MRSLPHQSPLLQQHLRIYHHHKAMASYRLTARAAFVSVQHARSGGSIAMSSALVTHTIKAVRGAMLRPFHNTAYRPSNSILNLSGLSVSRESRFLSKERGIPRTEFSPHLELIRSSEVNPFARNDVSSQPSAALSASTSEVKGVSQRLRCLMNELENSKMVNARAEAALVDLGVRNKRLEKGAAITMAVAALLAFGLGFSIDRGYLIVSVPRRSQTWPLQQSLSVDDQGMLEVSNTSHDQPSGYPSIKESEVHVAAAAIPDDRLGDYPIIKVLEEYAAPAAVADPKPGFLWSQLLWAPSD